MEIEGVDAEESILMNIAEGFHKIKDLKD